MEGEGILLAPHRHISALCAAAVVAFGVCLSPAHAAHPLKPSRLRQLIYRTHPCLARIVDVEDHTWDPTISYGGGHNVNDSYGLWQANPGTKMKSAGKDWRTNPWTQLRWAVSYANSRYGSECQAWQFRATHGYW